MTTLDDVRREDERGLYPQHALDGCETALIMFAAGFYGRQDAVWVCDAGLAATCVDLDGDRLGWMETRYPDGWEYVAGNAFVYAAAQDGRRTWDLVTLDPPTSLFRVCATLMPLWARLARRAIVVGCGRDVPHTPPRWRPGGVLRRSGYQGGVYWATYLKGGDE